MIYNIEKNNPIRLLEFADIAKNEEKAFMDFVGEVDELDEENMSAWWD